MSFAAPTDQDLIDGILTEIPEGTTTLDLLFCREEVKEIANLPASLTSVIFWGCKKLKKLPQLPDGITDLNLNNCNELEEIINLPASLTSASFRHCENLKKLPQFPDGITILNLDFCRELEEITNLPASLKEAYLYACKKLKKLPQLPDGITDLNLNQCNELEEIINFPESLKAASFRLCENLKKLPQLPDGITYLNLEYCQGLEEITNLPASLKKINLIGCNNLVLTETLLTRLEELENQDCEIIYPRHFDPYNLATDIKNNLNSLVTAYNEKNPSFTFNDNAGIEILLHRFLTEGIGQRSEQNSQRARAKEIAQSTIPTLNALEKNMHLLPVLDELSTKFTSQGGCINQPVRGWAEISALLAIAQKDTMIDKLAATRQIFTLDYIASYVRELKTNELFGEMFEAEAGNALYREVYARLKERGTLPESWLGVPGPIAYEGGVRNFINDQNRIELVTNKITDLFFSLDSQQLANNICESQHNPLWREICFHQQMPEIRKEAHKICNEKFQLLTNELEKHREERQMLDETGEGINNEEINKSINNLPLEYESILASKTLEMTLDALQNDKPSPNKITCARTASVSEIPNNGPASKKPRQI